MDALTLLHNRNSSPRLTEPAPEGAVLEAMFKAAARAPDHSRLRPWRFLSIKGEGRKQLGSLLVEATQLRHSKAGKPALTAEEVDKLAAKPLRAPLIVVVIAKVTEHPKVPAVEQILSAGCAAQGLLLAAHAQGFAGVWRTGTNAYDETVKAGLGLIDGEELIGFIYLGTVDGKYKTLRDASPDELCQQWP